MQDYWQSCFFSQKILNSLIVFVAVVISGSCGKDVLAQITPDESLGTESSVVTPDVEIKEETADRIDGGAIRESNLFHSFQEFNVREGQSVYFASPERIENIFTRVTGNNPSNILGTLGVDGAANLLLLNPNGIVFGENSSLDIEGSFLGTTAESLLFRDGEEFSAVEPRTSLLTISVPLGLQFGSNPGNIMVQSPLEVPNGQNFTLLGGDINLEGTNVEVINGLNVPSDGITAPGGKIELGGLKAAGEVGINDDGNLNFPEGIAKADITLNNYLVDVRAGGGGFIIVNGRNLELFNSGIIAGIDFSVDFAQAQAGDIVINTSEKILLANSTSSVSEISNTTGDFSDFINEENNIETINTRGNAGDLIINTGSLEIIASGIGSVGIGSLTNGEGNAGNVEITATEMISLIEEGESTNVIGSVVLELGTGNGANVVITTPNLSVSSGLVSARTSGQGNAGTLKIETDNLILTEGGQIEVNTFSAGNGGKIDIQAGSIEILGIRANSPSGIFANTVGAGNGGDIEIASDSLIVRDGGQIDTDAQGTTGKAGDLKIVSEDFIQLSGNSINSESNRIPTALSSSTLAENAPAGNVRIETEQLIITEGAQIQAFTAGDGNGGNISIQAGSIDILGTSENGTSGIFANTLGAGDGGDIEITSDNLIVRDGGQIGTEAQGTIGQAGDLKIFADDLVQLSGISTVLSSSTTAENAPAGNVDIETKQLTITERAQIVAGTRGDGNGGDIEITSESLIVQNGGQIVTEAQGTTGQAGDLKIVADDFIQLSGISTILSSSTRAENATAGNLSIETDSLTITEGAQIQAFTRGNGNGGDINIQASSIEVLGTSANSPSGIFANTLGAGNGGNIEITSDSLIVQDGGQIGTEAQGTTGQAGDLKIVADDFIQLSGSFIDSEGRVLTSLSSSTAAENASAGNLSIKTEQLIVTEGAQILALTAGDGSAGNIDIQAGSVFLSGRVANSSSGIFAVSGGRSLEHNNVVSGSGNGGAITITTNNLNIQNQARIGSFSRGEGEAGLIFVVVNDFLEANDGTILNDSSQSSGGNIDITAGEIRLRGNSNITTAVQSGTGGGGNITLTADSVVAFDDSDIFAFSTDGVGGNITIDSPILFVNGFSADNRNVNPESLEGNNRVDINATGSVSGLIDIPDVNFLSDSLVELSENAIDTEELVANSCVVRDRPSSGTFIITGKGGLAVRPGNWAVSTYSTGDVRAIPSKKKTTSTENNWQPGNPIIEPQGIYRLSNGKLVLSRECSEVHS